MKPPPDTTKYCWFMAVDPSGEIDQRTLSSSAATARKKLAEGWVFTEEETAAIGYKRAFDKGWRIRAVVVVPRETWLSIERT